MYDAFEDANFMYLVLEYCSNGDLHHFLKKRGKPLPEQEGTYNTHSFYPVIYIIDVGVPGRESETNRIQPAIL